MHKVSREADDWNDDDFGDEDDGRDATIPCPYCGQEMYEDAPQCPHCGQYISAEDVPTPRHALLIIVGVILCLCALLGWLVNS